VLRCARFETDLAFGDVYLVPLNREYFSESHAGVIHRDEHARSIIRQRAAQLSLLIVVEKVFANIVFLRESNRGKAKSNFAVFLLRIEHSAKGGLQTVATASRPSSTAAATAGALGGGELLGLSLQGRNCQRKENE
jgi:hypothetical protein